MRLLRVLALMLFVLVAMLGVARGEDAAPAEAESVEVADPFEDWYGYFEFRSGALWNFDREEWTGYATVPVLGYRAMSLEAGVEINPNEKAGPTGAVVALTYSLGNLKDWGVDVPWARHLGIHVGPCARYDFESGETETSVVMSVVDLSFGEGNVERQKNR